MTLSTSELAIPAAFLGVAFHLGYFIRGEHFMGAEKLFWASVCAPGILFSFLTYFCQYSWIESLRITFTLLISLAVALATSILTYRNWYHPLKSYPGPLGARVSKLWHMRQNLKGEDTYKLLDRLHKQYGDYVRTGPNELSIIDSQIVEAAYGMHSKCIKSDWYDVSLPMTNLHQMRDRAQHDRRRRAGWDKAFNNKALRSYDTRVIRSADQLSHQLASYEGKPVNVKQWFHCFAYDVMGDLGFGKPFNTLENGQPHFTMEIIEAGTVILQFLSCVPWLVRILASCIPSSMNMMHQFEKYSEQCVLDAKARRQKVNDDIMSHLIEAEGFFGDKRRDELLLAGDARLVIVAGSDTTAATLSYTFYYLAKNKDTVQHIRSELAENKTTNDDNFSVSALQNLPYMNAVIHEVLRLHPPIASGSYRQTPREGLQVGSRWIPGNVNLYTPHYSLMRSPRNFAEPTSFIPERWTTCPNLVLNKNAYMPFSIGAMGCIGKQLAMNEIRTVLAKLVLEFDVDFAPGETGHALLENDKEVFTIQPGPLNLCLTPRL